MTFEQLITAVKTTTGLTGRIQLSINSYQKVSTNVGSNNLDLSLILTNEDNFIKWINENLTGINIATGTTYTDYFFTAATPSPIIYSISFDSSDGSFLNVDFILTITAVKETTAIIIIDSNNNHNYLDVTHPDENPKIYQIYDPEIRFNGADFRIVESKSNASTYIKTGVGAYPVLLGSVFFDLTNVNNIQSFRTSLNNVMAFFFRS